MDLRKLRLEQLDRSLAEPIHDVQTQIPTGGWLKTIRDALGITTRQFAKRLGVSQANVIKTEQSEAHGTITLNQLRKIAEALDCTVVYSLIPRAPLSEVIDRQAQFAAEKLVGRTAHSMSLENQAVRRSITDEQVKTMKQDLLSGRWSRLWD
jgi:predicted DNA-binding mobile mystery protein A